jgi:glycosyltransferase involved in cell wall biosynthesis
VPEVTHLTRHQQDLTRRLIRYAHAHRIKTAFLFYDALLSKWGIYEALRRPHELYMLELANADVVLPISRHVAQEIRSWWAARATRTVNAELVACPLPAEFPGVARVTLPATRAEEDIHIVSVGSLDRRKNQQALISALERLPEAVNGKKLRVTLVGLGESPSLPATARRNVRIEALGAVAEERLVSLYKECSFTVFPSLDEGFGLPIAESLWFGKPCICAGFGAMSELARGGGCFTVDPRSLEQLSTAIARFVMEPKLRHKLTEEACSRPLDTWSDYAGSVLNCLQPRP